MLACKIGPHSYMPSAFEINEYCKTVRHRICPLYFSFQGGRQRDLGNADSARQEQAAN